MNTKDRIKIMQAYIDGKKIQILSDGYWGDLGLEYEPAWNWTTYEYRIKPEPLVVYINIHNDGKGIGTTCYINKEDAQIGIFPDFTTKKFIEDV